MSDLDEELPIDPEREAAEAANAAKEAEAEATPEDGAESDTEASGAETAEDAEGEAAFNEGSGPSLEETMSAAGAAGANSSDPSAVRPLGPTRVESDHLDVLVCTLARKMYASISTCAGQPVYRAWRLVAEPAGGGHGLHGHHPSPRFWR